MPNINEISEYLMSQNKTFDFEVRLRPSDETIMLYVSQDKVAPKVKAGFTSLRQLNNLREKLKIKYARRSEIIFVKGEAQQELESGFYQILNRKFNDQVVSLYTSFRDESFVDAFIEVSDLTEDLEHKITNHFEKILDEAELRLGVLQWLDSPSNLPSSVAILRMLKKLQPIDLESFVGALHGEYSSLSDKWLNHKLDQLRKKGFVLRQKINNTYVLSDNALSVIPAGAGRTSSDIERALALGRKKW